MVLQFNNVNFSYKKRTPLIREFGLTVDKGMLFCLVGPNGAGKTTILKLISGIEKPKSGEIYIFGKNSKRKDNDIKEKTFVTIDEPAFYSNLTAYENLKIVCLYRNLSDDLIEDTLKIFNLKDDKTKYKHFSYGMKQRLTLASGFLFQPELVVLDEPFKGLDPSGVIMLRNLILDKNQNQGVTFIISSHLLREVGSFCTHYGIIKEGKLINTSKIDNNINELEDKYIAFIGTSNYE
jgi:ABC-type multidrug transport system ATPase subunit